MTEKVRDFDVWIIETNSVYQKVPYTVVTDWVQQGRILSEDQLRYSGTDTWVRIDAIPAFAAYLPKAEPHRAEDEAEALEPVQVDFSWRRREVDDDDDVDMIPLIDISLVLLIFFMMTAAVGGLVSNIKTPQVIFDSLTANPEMYWVGIDRDGAGQPQYSFGIGEKEAGEAFPGRQELLRAVADKLAHEERPVTVRVRGHEALPASEVQDTMAALEKYRGHGAGKIDVIYAEVSQKEAQ
jgi:biopolymer transport protein ExbD